MDKNRAIEEVHLTVPSVAPKEERKRTKKHKKENSDPVCPSPPPPLAAPLTRGSPLTQPTIKHEEKPMEKVAKSAKVDSQMKCVQNAKPIPIDFKIKSGENNRISFTVQSTSANDIRIAPQPIKMETLSLTNTTSSSNVNPIVMQSLERCGWIRPIPSNREDSPVLVRQCLKHAHSFTPRLLYTSIVCADSNSHVMYRSVLLDALLFQRI